MTLKMRLVKLALAEVRKTRTNAASIGSGVHHLADMALRASESDPKAWQVVRGYPDPTWTLSEPSQSVTALLIRQQREDGLVPEWVCGHL